MNSRKEGTRIKLKKRYLKRSLEWLIRIIGAGSFLTLLVTVVLLVCLFFVTCLQGYKNTLFYPYFQIFISVICYCTDAIYEFMNVFGIHSKEEILTLNKISIIALSVTLFYKWRQAKTKG